MYHKAKYMDTRVYKVRQLTSSDNPEVKLWKVGGFYQPSDIFTKTIPRVSFECHRSKIMDVDVWDKWCQAKSCLYMYSCY